MLAGIVRIEKDRSLCTLLIMRCSSSERSKREEKWEMRRVRK
jgi:hypothetical protein